MDTSHGTPRPDLQLPDLLRVRLRGQLELQKVVVLPQLILEHELLGLVVARLARTHVVVIGLFAGHAPDHLLPSLFCFQVGDGGVFLELAVAMRLGKALVAVLVPADLAHH